MRRCDVHIDVAKNAAFFCLGIPLQTVSVERRSNRPLLYGDFGRMPVVATTEQAASGGFGRNPAKRKCLKSRFLEQICNSST